MSLKLMSLGGLAAFIALAWAISIRRDKFPWRTVLSGLGLQFTLAFLIFLTPFGKGIFGVAKTGVEKLLDFAKAGTGLVFGKLALDETAALLAVTITGTIILVATISSLLYHLGILQRVVRVMAWVMQRIMGTSGSESLCSAANVFMGQTEAPLVIKPYLAGMTKSEIMTMMVCGMATIAGGVFAVYASFGKRAGFEDMAGHLLTASVMAAPAALYVAKILLPEEEKSPTAGGAVEDVPRETTNSLDALCRGASDGMKLSINVIAMLIAFTAIVALANYPLMALQGEPAVMTLLGLALFAGGGLWLCNQASSESMGWGLACLLVPGAACVYAIRRWKQARWALVIHLAGIVLIMGGILVLRQVVLANFPSGPVDTHALLTAGHFTLMPGPVILPEPVQLQHFLGWLNAPFAYLMGVPWDDCAEIGRFLGERILLTEFIGYDNLTKYAAANPNALHDRSFKIAIYALCGFANFASIAIQIGGIGSLAPSRRKDLASLGLRAMAGGILVSYINACIAGLFI